MLSDWTPSTVPRPFHESHGIGVIDGNLTEINVTSPTGIRAIARLGGPDVAAKLWDAIEKKRAEG